jgi:hypothetical protein
VASVGGSIIEDPVPLKSVVARIHFRVKASYLPLTTHTVFGYKDNFELEQDIESGSRTRCTLLIHQMIQVEVTFRTDISPLFPRLCNAGAEVCDA